MQDDNDTKSRVDLINEESTALLRFYISRIADSSLTLSESMIVLESLITGSLMIFSENSENQRPPEEFHNALIEGVTGRLKITELNKKARAN